jgi:hypothetical protein
MKDLGTLADPNPNPVREFVVVSSWSKISDPDPDSGTLILILRPISPNFWETNIPFVRRIACTIEMRLSQK